MRVLLLYDILEDKLLLIREIGLSLNIKENNLYYYTLDLFWFYGCHYSAVFH